MVDCIAKSHPSLLPVFVGLQMYLGRQLVPRDPQPLAPKMRTDCFKVTPFLYPVIGLGV